MVFPDKESYGSIFRKLYYHLYTNGNASRAETIIEDLAKVLLIKLGAAKRNLNFIISTYLAEEKSANEALMPIARMHFPEFLRESDTFALNEYSIRKCFSELEYIDLSTSQSHILGDAFQSLIGPILRGEKGQFFTPKSIVRAMVEILNPDKSDTIVDPACGTGGFLLEAYNHILQKESSFEGLLAGVDKDSFLSKTAQFVCEIYAPGKSRILNGNSLDLIRLKQDFPAIFNADLILTNPPFGAKIGISDKAILQQYELGYSWSWLASQEKWVKTNHLLASQDPQILFVELCVSLLKNNGRMGIVLPEGVFGNKSSGYVWDFLKQYGHITAMLDCPRTAFQPSTDVKTNILFFQKTTEPAENAPFRVATATHCGHDRRGRILMENGQPYPDDFPLIAADFRKKKPIYWTTGVIRDKYYLVPRYCNSLDADLLKKEFKGEVITFGEMVKRKYISVRKGDEVGSEAYGSGDIPFVRTSDISNLEITTDPTKSVSDEIFKKYSKGQNIQEGDILMVADGRYRIGKTAIVLGNPVRYVVQSHLKIIKVTDKAPLSAFELLYILNLPMVQRQIRNLIFIQSTLGSLGNRLNELLLPIPERTPEWLDKVGNFEQMLKQRHTLMQKIRAFQGEEII